MKGVIAGGDKQTITAGEEILAQGGNAIDAAIAVVRGATQVKFFLSNHVIRPEHLQSSVFFR